jgi:hypothetical protein
VYTLEEIVSKSTLLATRPSRFAPKKCINKSIWLATGGAPSMGTPRVPSRCQPNWFVYAFSWVRSPQRRVDLDTISSSDIYCIFGKGSNPQVLSSKHCSFTLLSVGLGTDNQRPLINENMPLIVSKMLWTHGGTIS